MKKRVLLVFLSIALWSCGTPALSDLSGSLSSTASAEEAFPSHISYFYQALAPYGRWVYLEPYGWVWYPTDVPADWRPYTDGYWVFTSAYGWTWVSAQPWGWAPFHYGRWLEHPAYNWVWIPGTVWSPAWVAWRQGDGFIGWAPLPPGVQFSYGWEPDYLDRDIGWHCWSFVPENRFLDRRIERVIIPYARNRKLLHYTRNVTRYTALHDTFINNSIDVGTVERATRQKVTRYAVREVDRPAALSRIPLQGNQLTLFKPRVSESSTPATPSSIGRAVHGTVTGTPTVKAPSVTNPPRLERNTPSTFSGVRKDEPSPVGKDSEVRMSRPAQEQSSGLRQGISGAPAFGPPSNKQPLEQRPRDQPAVRQSTGGAPAFGPPSVSNKQTLEQRPALGTPSGQAGPSRPVVEPKQGSATSRYAPSPGYGVSKEQAPSAPRASTGPDRAAPERARTMESPRASAAPPSTSAAPSSKGNSEPRQASQPYASQGGQSFQKGGLGTTIQGLGVPQR